MYFWIVFTSLFYFWKRALFSLDLWQFLIALARQNAQYHEFGNGVKVTLFANIIEYATKFLFSPFLQKFSLDQHTLHTLNICELRRKKHKLFKVSVFMGRLAFII